VELYLLRSLEVEIECERVREGEKSSAERDETRTDGKLLREDSVVESIAWQGAVVVLVQ
jgi:hypothetical protein